MRVCCLATDTAPVHDRGRPTAGRRPVDGDELSTKRHTLGTRRASTPLRKGRHAPPRGVSCFRDAATYFENAVNAKPRALRRRCHSASVSRRADVVPGIVACSHALRAPYVERLHATQCVSDPVFLPSIPGRVNRFASSLKPYLKYYPSSSGIRMHLLGGISFLETPLGSDFS